MVVKETDVWIQRYLGDHDGFRGVVKHRYSDFIVHEVRLDGSMVKLTGLEPPAEYAPPRQSLSEARERLAEFLTESVLEQVEALISEVDKEKSSLTFPAGDNKIRRKEIHCALKAFDNLSAETVTLEDDKKAFLVRRCEKGADSNSRKRRRDPSVPPGSYTTFVLYKENIDTTEAIVRICELLRLPPKRFSYAGTKDKRAITTQEVRVKGVTPLRISQLNKAFHRRGQILLGNANTDHKEPLLLGQLSGNHFKVLLRSLDPSATEASIAKAVASVTEKGFVNYFGLQRFGGGATPTHLVGVELLRGNFEKAVKLILEPLDPTQDGAKGELHPERAEMVATLRNFLTGQIDAAQALNALPHRMKVERMILESYSLQSYIWNAMATERVRTDAEVQFAREGDLISITDEGGDPAGTGQSQENNDGEETIDTYHPEVRHVTAEEAEDTSIPIAKVLLPLIGENCKLPGGEAGKVARKIMDDLSIDLVASAEKVMGLNLYGSYRRLIAYPRDVEAEIVSYEDENEDILLTDKKELYGEVRDRGGGTGKGIFRGLRVSFTLQRAEYATMFLRELTRIDSSAEVQKKTQVGSL